MTTTKNPVLRMLSLGLAAIAALALVAISSADARPGGSKSSGSRGERTFSAPPATNTAPKAAAPIERSMTQPGKAAAGAATAGAATAAAQAAKPSMMRNLLLGGLMGAGLMALFGMGGGLASVLGFLLQAVLIAAVVMLVIAFFRNRMGGGTPATAAASAGGQANARQPDVASMLQRQGMGGAGANLQATPKIDGDDFNAFEQRLYDIQLAYGRGDVDALSRMATPEMLSYFAGELHENKQKGLRNDIAEPKLLQGDLSEAWREANAEYATVAMRYSLFDVTVDGSGRVVAGSKTAPAEVTELWTFVRPVGGNPQQWELSAIQQAG